MTASKNIFITGADGFIGSHLVEFLVKNNNNVTALCYYNSFNSYGWLDTLDKNILKNTNIVMGDIRDQNLLTHSSKQINISHQKKRNLQTKIC